MLQKKKKPPCDKNLVQQFKLLKKRDLLTPDSRNETVLKVYASDIDKTVNLITQTTS